MRNNEKSEKFSTENNVPCSNFILNKVDDVLKQIKAEDLYQYPNHNFNFSFLNTKPYINFGTDGIIRDVLYLNRGKNINYNKQNYKMVEFYAKEYNLVNTNYICADVIYISNPNNMLLTKVPNNKILEMIQDPTKIFIIDLSYDVYNYEDVNDFFNFVNSITRKNTFVLFGLSKMLGLPGLRVGFCSTLNNVFNTFHQPWQVTSFSKLIIDNLFNINDIQKHRDIIMCSKMYFKEHFKRENMFDTDGPFLALNKTGKEQGTKFKRFSVIDIEIYNAQKERL